MLSHVGYPLGAKVTLFADSPARDVRLNIGDKIEVNFKEDDNRNDSDFYVGTFAGIHGNQINEAVLFIRTGRGLEIGINIADIHSINTLD